MCMMITFIFTLFTFMFLFVGIGPIFDKQARHTGKKHIELTQYICVCHALYIPAQMGVIHNNSIKFRGDRNYLL